MQPVIPPQVVSVTFHVAEGKFEFSWPNDPTIAMGLLAILTAKMNSGVVAPLVGRKVMLPHEI